MIAARQPHPVHWVTAALIALLVLLVSGVGWSLFSSSLQDRPARPAVGVTAPSLPDLKLPSAPRPMG